MLFLDDEVKSNCLIIMLRKKSFHLVSKCKQSFSCIFEKWTDFRLFLFCGLDENENYIICFFKDKITIHHLKMPGFSTGESVFKTTNPVLLNLGTFII